MKMQRKTHSDSSPNKFKEGLFRKGGKTLKTDYNKQLLYHRVLKRLYTFTKQFFFPANIHHLNNHRKWTKLPRCSQKRQADRKSVWSF